MYQCQEKLNRKNLLLFDDFFILTYIPISSQLKVIFFTLLFFVILIFVVFFFLNTKKSNFNLNLFFKKISSLKKIKNKKLIKHFGKGVGNFTSYFRKTIFNKKILPYGLLLSVIYSLVIFLSPYFLFLSLGFHVGFFTVLIAVSLGALIGDLSPIPGGVGAVETFMVIIYSIFGINLEIAIMVSILSRLIIYFHNFVFGGISLLWLERETE